MELIAENSLTVIGNLKSKNMVITTKSYTSQFLLSMLTLYFFQNFVSLVSLVASLGYVLTTSLLNPAMFDRVSTARESTHLENSARCHGPGLSYGAKKAGKDELTRNSQGLELRIS